MTYFEWKKQLVDNYLKGKENEMKQFGIYEINTDNDIGKT